jgi:hypothetical protein
MRHPKYSALEDSRIIEEEHVRLEDDSESDSDEEEILIW